MTYKCPYCGNDLPEQMQIPVMSERMLRVYKTVAASGPKGVKSVNLIDHLYEFGRKPAKSANGQLRKVIHEMNKVLAAVNQRVMAHPYRRYRLYSTDGETNGSTLKKKIIARDRDSGHKHQDAE